MWLLITRTARSTALPFYEHDSRTPACLPAPGSPSGSIAATAGALGLRLGGAAWVQANEASLDSVTGQEPQLHHLKSVVGLVWRTVVMWFVLLTLLSLARLLG